MAHRWRELVILSLVVAVGLSVCGAGTTQVASAPRPNILLIVADDLGYSDIGVFGGEIDTPNLDALAAHGVQLTQFHVATNCSPTRAMLMTGMDNHLVGLGTMAEVMRLRYPELRSFPGYEGYLALDSKALPEVLQEGGYRTYMTGKWHLGLEAETSPHARGFQRTFALLDGAGGHMDDRQVVPGMERETVLYREDGQLTSLPDDFYSTRTFSEKLISYLIEDQNSSSPFFAYLAFTAPHWPLQAPRQSIARYEGDYDQGYERLFEQRLARQKSLGLIADDVQGQPLQSPMRPWGELNEHERRISARKMEIYAAMVGDMDQAIGQVLDALRQTGELENTVVLFMSDNGAEGNTADRAPAWRRFVDAHFDNRYHNLGATDSYFFYGPEWARVSALPSKYFKSNTTQGGILSPAIVSYPGAEQAARYDDFLSVMDVMPTVLELADIDFEADVDRPLMGRSFASLLTPEPKRIHPEDHEMGWEMVNHRAYRRGDWKLVMTQPPWGEGAWQLYNLADDPSESRDLAPSQPDRLAELIRRWHAYAAAHQVAVFVEGRPPVAERPWPH